jgi:hypothetical protein
MHNDLRINVLTSESYFWSQSHSEISYQGLTMLLHDGTMDIWSNASWCSILSVSVKNSLNDTTIHAVFTGVRRCLLRWDGDFEEFL